MDRLLAGLQLSCRFVHGDWLETDTGPLVETSKKEVLMNADGSCAMVSGWECVRVELESWEARKIIQDADIRRHWHRLLRLTEKNMV